MAGHDARPGGRRRPRQRHRRRGLGGPDRRLRDRRAPGEIFGAIGTAVRRQSPAPVTIFAGYSQGSLGYVATPDEYPFGGYEPSVSHRGYGQPAPFSPEAAGIIEQTAVELLHEVFA